jgi:hypothetical protein
VKELCRVAQFGLEHQEGPWRIGHGSEFPDVFVADAGEFCGSDSEGIGNPAPAAERAPAAPEGNLLPGGQRGQGVWDPAADQPGEGAEVILSISIDPRGLLRELGYRWQYSLEDALADWKQDLPSDFSI